MSKFHDYEYRNISTCKECDRIYKKHGDTDAQIEDYHMAQPFDENSVMSDSESETNTEPQLYSPYKEIIRNNPTTPIAESSSKISAKKWKKPHYYTSKTKDTCKECKRLDAIYGYQDAQPDYNVHDFEPIHNKRKSSKLRYRRRNKSSKKSKNGGRKTQKRNLLKNKNKHRKTAKN